MARLFFSYSHRDEELRDRLEVHLAALRREGSIDTWHDRRITAGDDFANAIDENLERADIILLLVSADFIASRYCYEIEMMRAMERHAAGEARVIPVILDFCDWHGTPFGRLQAVPRDGKPVAAWANLNEAFLNVVIAIRTAVPKVQPEAPPTSPVASAAPPRDFPRSGNLRVRRSFTDADRSRFLQDAFDFMKRFFQGSLHELQARHPQIEAQYRDIDANTFTAVIYENGRRASECCVRLGGFAGDGITYSSRAEVRGNGFNEQLTVEDDEVSLFLRPMGMMMHLNRDEQALTHEGAAEYYWTALIQPLQ